MRDELTTALRRTDFIAALRAAKEAADRDAAGLVLCLLDLDQLRNVNDRHGQATGDAALRAVAERVQEVLGLVRWRDLESVVARFDGDSLLLMLRRARLADGERLAEEIRQRVAAEPFTGDLSITVAIGVTAYRSGESVDMLLARTEKTLYLAKQFGGDCVETSWTPESRGASARITSLADAEGLPLFSLRRLR